MEDMSMRLKRVGADVPRLDNLLNEVGSAAEKEDIEIELRKVLNNSAIIDGECVSFPNSAGGRLESKRCGESETSVYFNDDIEKVEFKPVRQMSLRHQTPKEIKLRPVSTSEKWMRLAIKENTNKKSKGKQIIYAKDVQIPDSEPGVARSTSAAEVLVQSHGRRLRVKQPKKGKKVKVKRAKARQLRYGHVMKQTADNDEYLLSLGMMVGLRVAVGRQENPNEPKELTVSDFYQVDNYIFPPSGGKGVLVTPAHNLGHTFKFKEYAPKIFKRIRNHFKIEKMRYMLSVAGNCDFLEFFSNAKSGEFFFYSHDENFMIKTMKKAETRFLRRILPFYYEHIRKHPDTLLVRFCGMYRVKMHHINRKVHFMVMHSVFDTPKEMHFIYDLKGSTAGRKKKEGQMVGKDLDLVESNTKLHMGRQKEVFIRIIREDVEFLSKMNIMDYSLLLGINDRSRPLATAVSTRDYHDNYINESGRKDAHSAIHKRHSAYGVVVMGAAEELLNSDNDDDDDDGPAPMLGKLAGRGYSKRIKEPEDWNRSNGSGGEYSSESEYESEDYDDADFNHSEPELEFTEDLHRIAQLSINSIPASVNVHELATSRTGSFSTVGDHSGVSPTTHSTYSVRDPMSRLIRRRDLGIPSYVSSNNQSVRGQETYYMGIIDILQEYNMQKHAETAFKSNILRQSKVDISCVDPELYAKRFLEFIIEQTD